MSKLLSAATNKASYKLQGNGGRSGLIQCIQRWVTRKCKGDYGFLIFLSGVIVNYLCRDLSYRVQILAPMMTEEAEVVSEYWAPVF